MQKTAQRIILELKGKLSNFSADSITISGKPHNTTLDDALIALVNLGISKAAAESALKKIQGAESLSVVRIN